MAKQHCSFHSQGLYRSEDEHDACGLGFIAHIKGQKSHAIIQQGLNILGNLDHRGARGADKLMGDGAGILIQIPDALYREDMALKAVTLPGPGEYGVVMVFLPKEIGSRLACEQALERAVRHEGQVVLGWRDVPVDHDMSMSDTVRACTPTIRQLFIGRGPNIMVPDALERKLYVIRKTASHAIKQMELAHSKEYFVPSASVRTVVYKGLLLVNQVGQYYQDLADSRAISALALVHQRFSTNTFPSWPLAHPFRMIAHNGEINTIKGNANWLRAREGAMKSAILGEDLSKLYPIITPNQSDTATLDNCLELLVNAGYSIAHAMMLMIPEPWEQHHLMDKNRHAFYEYHAAMMEPWDGPSAVVFTDGRQIGATLDRNGLRPARYLLTSDDLVVMASEAGTLPIPEERIIKKWRLQPGKMLLIDLQQGRLIDDHELKSQLANHHPYHQWLEHLQINLEHLPALDGLQASSHTLPLHSKVSLATQQKAFGWTAADYACFLTPGANNREEVTRAIGPDEGLLAVLSNRTQSFYNYFKQLFAQVTNPPIDPIREQMVMSLVSFIGPKPNLLDINHVNPPLRLKVSQPILDLEAMAQIRHIKQSTRGKFRCLELDITYPVIWGTEAIEAELASLCARAADAVQCGYNILILSDRLINSQRMAIPALLATSAVHQHLIRVACRTRTGLIIETGSAREVHHFALLGGYGAEAIHPYLVLQTLREMPDSENHIKNFIQTIGKGLNQIMSKMGISTYMSYTGAQIFEAIGLHSALVQKYFNGTASGVEGINVFDVAQESLRYHQGAFNQSDSQADILNIESHAVVHPYQGTPSPSETLKQDIQNRHYANFKEYTHYINEQNLRHMTLRALFDWQVDASRKISLEEVESAVEIIKRFSIGTMTLEAISNENHKALLTEDFLRARIKEVGSGRFGVTAKYLISADQLQIKIAQDISFAENGQTNPLDLPNLSLLNQGIKNTSLISGLPHHDIYSIEDLAQLIHDLKNVNPKASISVKLVSEGGIGTIAAGVAKAKADHLVITGHDGNLGDPILSTIEHIGTPWELGLAEAQQTLVLNRLRSRVRLQVDGQMKTGRDVVIAALLGADEFGFAAIPLITSYCLSPPSSSHPCASNISKPSSNTFPLNPSTQQSALKDSPPIPPPYVVDYFLFIAEQIREIMAQLGVRQFKELIGRTDWLDMRAGLHHWKTKGLDFSRIFYQSPGNKPKRHTECQDHGLENALDLQLIERCQAAFTTQEKVFIQISIRNSNRSLGARLSGEVVSRFGEIGLPDHTIHIVSHGTAGQSFAAFLAHGITLELIGQANDYVGKGLSGGRVIVRTPKEFKGSSTENIIAGNTLLYGATSGEAFFNGVVGERFAVRNSGAIAVVEGTGDHACEYMTAGIVVILGPTGRNFAAGMSGGVAYVWDPQRTLHNYCHSTSVKLLSVLPDIEQPVVEIMPNKTDDEPAETDETLLRRLITYHEHYTASSHARDILNNWTTTCRQFLKIVPTSINLKQ